MNNSPTTVTTTTTTTTEGIKLHPNRCLLVRNRHAACSRCAHVCTTDALTPSPQGIKVDADLCIGCGTCASACPTGCLEALQPTDQELFARTSRGIAYARESAHASEKPMEYLAHYHGDQPLSLDHSESSDSEASAFASDPRIGIAFACEQAAGPLDPGKVVGLIHGRTADTCVIGVTCLGRVEEALLTQTTALGIDEILLVSGHCDTCPHHHGGELCTSIVESVNNLLAGLDVDSPLIQIVGLPETYEALESESALSRKLNAPTSVADTNAQEAEISDTEKQTKRALSADGSFGHIAATILPKKRGYTPQYQHVQADGTLPHFIPERRLRLYNSLKALGSPQEPTVTTRVWGQVHIDTDLCRSCRMCTVFCPTGALSRINMPDGSFGVEHRSSLCTQCRTCEVICPEQALHVSDTVEYDDFLSGKKYRTIMPPIGWNPSGTDAIATRMARFIKADNVQDPQAGIKPVQAREQRTYVLEREAKRREIRADKTEATERNA